MLNKPKYKHKDMTETNTIRREKNRLIKTKIETKTKQKQNNMMKGGQGNKTY